MKNSLVIFINQNYWNDNIWKNFQIERYSKEFKVVAYELGNIINPNLKKIFNNRKKSILIKRFKTISEWNKHFISLSKKNYKKILLINLVRPNKLKSFIVLKELTKFEHPIVEFYNNYIPFEMNYKKKFGHYLNILFKPSYIKLKIVEIIFNFLSKFLFYNNYFFLICGTEKKKFFKKNCIESSYIDYNKSSSRANSKIYPTNFVVFLENKSLFHKGDEQIFIGLSKNIPPKEFYSKLCIFFDQIEHRFRTKVIIASHPKSLHKRNPKYFGNRQVFLNKTDELVKRSKFVLTEPSQAISHIIKYKKPSLLIYHKDYLTNYVQNQIENISKLIKIKSCDINEIFPGDKIINLLKINKKKYNIFEKKYLLASKKNLHNYELLKAKFL